jgi:hypothetical protein
MPVLLPQSYNTGSVARIAAEPATIGDHIRRRRLAFFPSSDVMNTAKGIHVDPFSAWGTTRSGCSKLNAAPYRA